MLGDNCSASCLTKDHATWGECVRDKGLKISWAASAKGLDKTREKKWDKNLDEYQSLVRQGVQPRNTWPSGVKEARDRAEKGIME